MRTTELPAFNRSTALATLLAFGLALSAAPPAAATESADALVIEGLDGAADPAATQDAGPADLPGEILIDAAPGPDDGADRGLVIEPEADSPARVAPPAPARPAQGDPALRAGVDALRLELGVLDGAAAPVDTTNYLHAAFSLDYAPDTTWEAALALRLDGHQQTGDPDFAKLDLDYGESFIRYRGERFRLTAGAQTIIWGRIDELPPTDRLSVVDLSRFILDDLQDRRRPTLALRAEAFLGADSKLDLVWVPVFRAAVLPERDSVWFPVDRERGRILGIAPDPLLAAIVQGASFDEDAPDGDGGWGARYSRSASAYDLGLTLQRNRQTTPYYAFLPATNTFQAQYPRAWSSGADIAFELGGLTWRGELAWISDFPVTRSDFSYTTVEAVNWAGGVEFHPGDGDTRVNLQIVGLNLIDAPAVLDRTEIYSFNGALDIPLARERWRLNTRFFVGLDEHDLYLNPELAFLGWEPHEAYIAVHYFEGAASTLGGFHEDHSVLTLGWRSRF